MYVLLLITFETVQYCTTDFHPLVASIAPNSLRETIVVPRLPNFSARCMPRSISDNQPVTILSRRVYGTVRVAPTNVTLVRERYISRAEATVSQQSKKGFWHSGTDGICFNMVPFHDVKSLIDWLTLSTCARPALYFFNIVLMKRSSTQSSCMSSVPLPSTPERKEVFTELEWEPTDLHRLMSQLQTLPLIKQTIVCVVPSWLACFILDCHSIGIACSEFERGEKEKFVDGRTGKFLSIFVVLPICFRGVVPSSGVLYVLTLEEPFVVIFSVQLSNMLHFTIKGNR